MHGVTRQVLAKEASSERQDEGEWGTQIPIFLAQPLIASALPITVPSQPNLVAPEKPAQKDTDSCITAVENARLGYGTETQR